MSDLLQDYLTQLHSFLKSNDPSRHLNAPATARDIFNLALDIPKTEAGYCSSILFNEEFGLLKFLKVTSGLKDFEGVKVDIFRFLSQYCDDSFNGNYIKLIKDSCISSYSCDASVKVKTGALNLLQQLISWNLESISSDLITDIISRFWSDCLRSAKLGATLRCSLYEIMGVLAERFPELLTEISDRLLSLYLSFLRQEIDAKKKKPELLVIAGCLKGLSGYLMNFSHSVSEGSRFAGDIYSYTKRVMITEYKRYDALKAALHLFQLHCAQFKELIMDDAEEIYESLKTWSNHSNKEVRELAAATSDAFLIQISACISENSGEEPKYEKILMSFMRKFSAILNEPTSASKEISIAVKGYGKFAEACKSFLSDEDMKRVFEQILKKSEQCYMNFADSHENEKTIHQLPVFLEALSRIINSLKEVSSSSIASTAKIIILLFDYYPKLGKTGQKKYNENFGMFIQAISSSSSLLKTSLSHIIYQCLIRTVSHETQLSELAADEANNYSEIEVRVSYKTFVPMWNTLLDYRSYKVSKLDEDHKALSLKEVVYDEMIKSILSILRKLNLNSDKKGSTENDTLIQEEGGVSSDPTANLIAEIPKDFQLLVNLVDFCKAVLMIQSKSSFSRWIYVFSEEVITLSLRYPLVSGLYKLMQVASYVIEETSYLKEKSIDGELDKEKKTTHLLMVSYMKEVVAGVKQYTGDLLVSCLQFLLTLPVEIVKDSTQLLIPSFLKTFQLGLSYFELADLGLSTLLKWNNFLNKEDMKLILIEVLPSLDDYLQSPSTDETENVTETVSLTHSERKIKRIPVRYLKALILASKQTIESPLMKLKLKIIHFLGSLGGESNIYLLGNLGETDIKKAIAWDGKKHLPFALPLKDIKPTIYLDNFLPRVVELALHSSNRQSKVVACELLHALTLFMVGKSVQLPGHQVKKDSMESLYRKVFPALITLACSSEQVAEQLFSPLVFQIIHWLTGNRKYESTETMILLDTILDGVTNSHDNSLRDFSAKCVKEFLRWSIKQTSEKQLEKNPGNPKSLFKRMNSLALHPKASKRLGAAIVFNNIYSIFREEESLVDRFTLAFLVVFVKSLSLSHKDEKSVGTSRQCEVALSHLERIIIKKSRILMKGSKHRKKPIHFNHLNDFNLIHINVWLMIQCGSPDTVCRHQCMKLVMAFLPLQEGISSTKDWMKKTISAETNRGKYFTDKFEKGSYKKYGIRYYPTLEERISPKFSIHLAMNWLENLLGSLDCYYWVFSTKLLTATDLFAENYDFKLMKSVSYFIDELASLDANNLITKYLSNGGVVPSDFDKYNRIKCTVVVRTTNLLTLMLTEDLWTCFALKSAMESILSENLFELVIQCMLCPHSIGFNVFDVEISKNLPIELMNLSKALLKYSPATIKEKFIRKVSQLLTLDTYNLRCYLPFNFEDTRPNSFDSLSIMQLVCGYMILMETGLLKQVLPREAYKNIHDGLIFTIGNNLIKLRGGTRERVILPHLKILSDRMMELLLTFEDKMSEDFLDLLFDIRPTTQSTQRVESRGAILYHFFADILHRHVLKKSEHITDIICRGIQCPKLLFCFLQGILTACQKSKDKVNVDSKKIAESVLNHWAQLHFSVKFDWELKTVLTNIAKLIMCILPVSIQNSTFFDWIISMLKENSDLLSTKEPIIDMLPSITGHCREDQKEELKGQLIHFIANRFPITSKDVDYLSCLNKMLSAMEVSLCPMIFEVLVVVIIRERGSVYEKMIEPSLSSFIKRIKSTDIQMVFDYCIEIFNDDQKYSNLFRRGVIERICLPCLQHLRKLDVKHFFVRNIKMLTSHIDEKYIKVPEEKFEIQLINKICCFKVTSLMFELLGNTDISSPSSAIALAYAPESTTGKELISFLSRSASKICKDDYGESILKELRRESRCCAYNCLITSISCTQTDLKFYSGLLFSENPSKNSFIFENIIDQGKVYRFDSEIKSPLEKKKMLKLMRRRVDDVTESEVDDKRKAGFIPYISSQYLMGTSLSEDVSQFDFNVPADAYNATSTTQVDSETHESSERVTGVHSDIVIDIDELNQHECMSKILGVMEHMKDKKVYHLPEKDCEAIEMPSWMLFLHKKMVNRGVHQNIKLFIAKVIVNAPKIFEPFGQFWFPPFTDLILRGEIEGPPLNCMVIDLIVTMLSWSSTVIPEDSVTGRSLASSLLDYMIQHCHHPNLSILKNYLQIIKTMLHVWRDILEIPYKTIHQSFNCSDEKTKDNLTGIQILGFAVESGFSPYNYQIGLSEEEFFTDLVKNIMFKYKDVFASAAEVCSLALKYYQDNNRSTNKLTSIVNEPLTQFSKTMKEKFIICLHQMHKNFPEIVDGFILPLLYCLSSLHGILKTQCMQCLAARVNHLTEEHENIYMQMKGKVLDGMLKHREEETQVATLRVISGIIRNLSTEQVIVILPKVAFLRNNTSVSIRELMYDLFMEIYDNYRSSVHMETDSVLKISRISKEILLLGISDPSTSLSLKVLNFWQSEERLPNLCVDRLIEILRVLYMSKMEKEYLCYATNLIMQLTSLSPDYSRPVFGSRLDSEENFRNYHVNFSWQRQNLSLAPLFVATQQSSQGSYSFTTESSLHTAMLRSTQKGFEFTQTNASLNWMNPTMQVTESFALPAKGSFSADKKYNINESYAVDKADGVGMSRQTFSNILRLKSKFIKDSLSQGHHFASLELRKQKAREKAREHQRAARDRKIVMYRKYRVGELPDIQIKHSELIVPLQALAQIDDQIAELLFSNVFSSIISMLPDILSEDNMDKAYMDIQESIDKMMRASTVNNPSFICGIENILCNIKEFSIEPQTIRRVSIVSMQQPLGILLLEKQLMSSSDITASCTKRRKGKGGYSTGNMHSWIELASLYESIKDYDFLRSIFSSYISVADVTREALAYEARNDYENALRLYREASSKTDWEDSPTDEEEEYWDSARLRCYEYLSMWSNLKDFTLKSIADDGKSADMQRIWEDELLQEIYLPCYMKSNLKLLCQGKVDNVHADFFDFIDDALKKEDSKEILQARYCDELALLNIFKDNYGASQHFLNIGMQRFLDDWSQMSKLVSAGRLTKLEHLQKIIEMEEFVNIMSSDDCKNENKVTELLSVWSRRSLEKKLHNTLAWDDIMLNRCSYIRKLRCHFMESKSFLRHLDVAEIRNILAVAGIARKQGNFAVASQYLRDSSETIFKSDLLHSTLPNEWRYIYVKIHCDKVKMFKKDTAKNICGLLSAKDHLGKCDINVRDGEKKVLHHNLLEYDVLNCLVRCIKLCNLSQFNSVKDIIFKIPSMQGLSFDKAQIIQHFHEQAFNILTENLCQCVSLDNSKEVDRKLHVKALLKMVLFCDDRIKEEDPKKEYYAEYAVVNLLKAMKLNSEKARLRFPRLLHLIELYPNTRPIFSENALEIPCWMFLGWTNQIVALIDKPILGSIRGILDAIGQAYPQALMYPLRVSGEHFKFPNDSEGRSMKLYFERLVNSVTSPLLEPFTQALGQLSHPFLVFKDFINLLQRSIINKDRDEVEACFKDLHSKLLYANGRRKADGLGQLPMGSIAKTFAEKFGADIEREFGKDGKKLIGMNEKDFQQSYSSLYKKMTAYKDLKISGNLKEFSPWLSDFQADHFHNHLEIAGQYNGLSKPIVEYHVKIAAFDERVLMLRSQRQPKCLTIHGDDEKDYKFLVKGGEDLRLDQRVEQIFDLMNLILKNDPVCGKRLLKLNTYQVIPLTSRIGIIEWVDNTIPYGAAMDNVMKEKEKGIYLGTMGPLKRHAAFLQKYGSGNSNYDNIYLKANMSDTIKSFEEKLTAVPWDLLRRVFTRMAASSEAYFILRKHFVNSYSCMCIAHYLLGIGDRHRSNTLIDTTSGGVVGIDFGHAFGSAIKLRIPELMPFRMTKQILNLLLPFEDANPYKQVMTAVMQAFRKHSNILLNTMDVFIKEPLLDWEVHPRNNSNAIKVQDGSNSSTWSPQHHKISVCQQKLSGINPAHIIAEELKNGHNAKPAVCEAYIAVAKGSIKHNIRTEFLERTKNPDDDNLSEEEQVNCLVDQATDPNILGRTYIGWEPWV